MHCAYSQREFSITKLKTNVFWVIFGSFSAASQIILQIPTIEVLLSIPHHGAVRPAKLYLLVGCLLTCLCTLSRHQASVWALRTYPSFLPQACRKIKTGSEKVFGFHAARRGSNKQEGGCSKEFHISSRCDHTVARAYKHINMGGCSYKNQELYLCGMVRRNRRTARHRAIVNRNVNKPEQS
jgi:hypothetical protein